MYVGKHKASTIWISVCTNPADLFTGTISIHIPVVAVDPELGRPDDESVVVSGTAGSGVAMLQLIHGSRGGMERPADDSPAGAIELVASAQVSTTRATHACLRSGTVVCLRKGECAVWSAAQNDSATPTTSGHHRDDGMSTVEYAIGTVVAAAFAAVLYRIVTGDSVVSGLTELINSALSTSF